MIPATSFIEWQKKDKEKQPFEIEPIDDSFLFAAIWERWQKDDQEIFSCSILTTESVASFSHIHHRQPVMLNVSNAIKWLSIETKADELKELTLPSLPTSLAITPISTSTNNARNKQLSEKIGESRIIE